MAKMISGKRVAASTKTKSTTKSSRSNRDRGGASRGHRTPYVRTGGGGAMRVGGSDVPLDSVVAAFHQGHSPEMIVAQYPSLTLEEVYGAIAYYLAHRKDVDKYLQRQDALWVKWRARGDASRPPVVERLRTEARSSASGHRTSP